MSLFAEKQGAIYAILLRNRKKGNVEYFTVQTSNAEVAFAKAFEQYNRASGEMLYGPHKSRKTLQDEIAEMEDEQFIYDYSRKILRGS